MMGAERSKSKARNEAPAAPEVIFAPAPAPIVERVAAVTEAKKKASGGFFGQGGTAAGLFGESSGRRATFLGG